MHFEDPIQKHTDGLMNAVVAFLNYWRDPVPPGVDAVELGEIRMAEMRKHVVALMRAKGQGKKALALEAEGAKTDVRIIREALNGHR